MKENRAIINAIPVEIAQGDETCKYATFLISVLDEYDRMGRMIPRESGEQYHETLRGFPIVAKLIKDRANRAIDFGGHEMRQWTKRNGEREVAFDTYPIGSVVDTWIEDREVAGYDGAKPCIMAKAKLWTCRSPEYFKVLDRLWQENKVSSSWELITTDVEEASLGRKILKAFSFIGNALLGTTSVPAVRGAGIYEYAEAEEQTCQTTEELNEALLKDINEEQEEISLEDNIIKETEPVENTATSAAPAAEDVGVAQNETEATPTADNTEAVAAEATPAEEEAATADTPEAAEPAPKTADTPAEPVADASATGVDVEAKIAELQSALLSANEANNKLQEDVARLQAELEALAPIKAEYEKLEAEKAEAEKQRQIAELRQYALNSGKITEAELADEGGDETIRSLIANLDKAGLNDLIVQRVTAAFTSSKPVMRTSFEYNTASVSGKVSNIRTNIADSSDKKTEGGVSLADRGESFVHAYINK